MIRGRPDRFSYVQTDEGRAPDIDVQAGEITVVASALTH